AIARLLYGAHWAAEGIFTLFAILFIFIGLQFFAFGILGEYIGRIYREVRKRPEYVIDKVYASDISGNDQSDKPGIYFSPKSYRDAM
ncbi:MAG: hypothetical protein KKA35_06725, partial [Proteobacteria bacterium]|nr:hypothetical protein [Pseudomonadota bacterium]